MFQSFSTAARRLVMFSWVEAGRVGSPLVDTEHLLLGMLRIDPDTLSQIGANLTLDAARQRAAAWHTPTGKHSHSAELPLSPEAKAALDLAKALSEPEPSPLNYPLIRTEHILLALLQTSCHAATMLEEAGASRERLEALIAALPLNQQQEGKPMSTEDFADLNPGQQP